MLFLSKDFSDWITRKIDMRDDRRSRADRIIAVSGQRLGIASYFDSQKFYILKAYFSFEPQSTK